MECGKGCVAWKFVNATVGKNALHECIYVCASKCTLIFKKEFLWIPEAHGNFKSQWKIRFVIISIQTIKNEIMLKDNSHAEHFYNEILPFTTAQTRNQNHNNNSKEKSSFLSKRDLLYTHSHKEIRAE